MVEAGRAMVILHVGEFKGQSGGTFAGDQLARAGDEPTI